MKKAATIFIAVALSVVLLGGCGRLGKTNRPDTSNTSLAIDELLSSLDDLPKMQSSQIEPTDTDLLIPSNPASTEQDKVKTASAIDELVASMNELPNTQLSQTEASDLDLLIP